MVNFLLVKYGKYDENNNIFVSYVLKTAKGNCWCFMNTRRKSADWRTRAFNILPAQNSLVHYDEKVSLLTHFQVSSGGAHRVLKIIKRGFGFEDTALWQRNP